MEASRVLYRSIPSNPIRSDPSCFLLLSSPLLRRHLSGSLSLANTWIRESSTVPTPLPRAPVSSRLYDPWCLSCSASISFYLLYWLSAVFFVSFLSSFLSGSRLSLDLALALPLTSFLPLACVLFSFFLSFFLTPFLPSSLPLTSPIPLPFNLTQHNDPKTGEQTETEPETEGEKLQIGA